MGDDHIYGSSLFKNKKDVLEQLCWQPNKSDMFEVNSFYSVILKGSVNPFPWKSIWRVKVPLKAAFFTQTTALGKIPTIDNLRYQTVCVVEWCYECNSMGRPLITCSSNVRMLVSYGPQSSVYSGYSGLCLREYD